MDDAIGILTYTYICLSCEGMDAADEVGNRPATEFQEDVKDPLIDLSLTDSNELWLIQWPINQAPGFDGQELSLKLHHDGLLGSFEGSSGKSYDVVSFNAQVPNATVFLSSASESKIVGKISRRVSLVHYPEPSELQKQNTNHQKQMYQRSSGTSLTNSSHHFATQTQSTRPRSPKSAGSNAASMHSSKYLSSLSEVGEPSKPSQSRHIEEPTRSMDQSTQDSGHGHSVVTSSGSLEQSNDRKSRKKKKIVE
ncbi:mediator-associated protein 2-like isoform X2 [Camellia sinensis]|uniref:mediator-associated protein 2-like isoform X2 n=1 Tax=Camellia sinensis TaxID=4442 RepID=UPI0010356AF7|nr:mediator-associated protein 2-like isoform X2 [Camellia sinensis]